MANRHVKLMDKREVFVAETGAPVDLLDCKSIVGQIRVLGAGSGGTVYLQHSATADGSAFTTLGSAVNLNAATNNVQTHSSFLRYVRFAANENVAGNPIACIDIVAKEK